MLEPVPGVAQAQQLGQHEVQEGDDRDDEDDRGHQAPPRQADPRHLLRVARARPAGAGRPRAVARRSSIGRTSRLPSLPGAPGRPCSMGAPPRTRQRLAPGRCPPLQRLEAPRRAPGRREERDETGCAPSRPAARRRRGRRRSARRGRRAPGPAAARTTSPRHRPPGPPLRGDGRPSARWRNAATAWQQADCLQGHRKGPSSGHPRTARRTRSSSGAPRACGRPGGGRGGPRTRAARSGSPSRRWRRGRTRRTSAPPRAGSARAPRQQHVGDAAVRDREPHPVTPHQHALEAVDVRRVREVASGGGPSAARRGRGSGRPRSDSRS